MTPELGRILAKRGSRSLTIAIESGAHFEGSVQRQDDPLNPGARNAKPGQGNPAAAAPQATATAKS